MVFLIVVGGLAFYLAINLGANDVANAMGTSVGSGALKLRQALIVAGILEFLGAVLFGGGVTGTLTGGIITLDAFAEQLQTLQLGMVSVLLTCSLWLQIATTRGWPVASSHAVVGAIAGFSWSAGQAGAISWSNLMLIASTWLLTPILSGGLAALLYAAARHWILQHPTPLLPFREWIPWLSALQLGVLGTIVLPTLCQPIQAMLMNQWGRQIPIQSLVIGSAAIAAVCLSCFLWQRLESGGFQSVETLLTHFQILSACLVAFAHGSNDVGNAVAPVVAIVAIQATGALPDPQTSAPLWILVLGGCGIVWGLMVWGGRVMTTVGEGIINLQPSSGFCAEMAAATTILLASRLGLPVSTTHALVGALVGIGLLQGANSLKFNTVKEIALAWGLTLPVAIALSSSIFKLLTLANS
jgi:inorganic phosphate transporter, PiT family